MLTDYGGVLSVVMNQDWLAVALSVKQNKL